MSLRPQQKAANNCPTCESPKRHLHPALQHEGEVQICNDSWHAEREEMEEGPHPDYVEHVVNV